jgi:hypothetical protein
MTRFFPAGRSQDRRARLRVIRSDLPWDKCERARNALPVPGRSGWTFPVSPHQNFRNLRHRDQFSSAGLLTLKLKSKLRFDSEQLRHSTGSAPQKLSSTGIRIEASFVSTKTQLLISRPIDWSSGDSNQFHFQLGSAVIVENSI